MKLEQTLLARWAAEGAGTFLFVVTIYCNIHTGQTVFGGISVACVLMVLIYSFGQTSGGNFNPAVTLALCMTKKLDKIDTFMYILAQMAAAKVAGGFSLIMFFGETFTLEPMDGYSWWQAGFAEALYTFMLCFVFLNTAASKADAGNRYFGLAVGFVVVAGAYSGGGISKGCFNPAVAFGLDVDLSKRSKYACILYCYPYALFELAGAVLAAGLFVACRPEEIAETLDAPPVEGPPLRDAPPAEGPPLPSMVLSEFLGTYMLVLTVGLNVLTQSPAAAFSIASCLMCMIFALGSCSGAHFNPAVTLAVLSAGHKKRFTRKIAAAFIAAQFLGGLCAAFTYMILTSGRSFPLYSGAYAWYQVVLAELLFTALLAFVVLSAATVKEPLSEYFGLAIGMCVVGGGIAIGKVSGGALNPAVSVGVSAAHLIGGGQFWPCIVYSVVELAAGVGAAGLFKLLQPSQFQIEEAESERSAYGSTTTA